MRYMKLLFINCFVAVFIILVSLVLMSGTAFAEEESTAAVEAEKTPVIGPRADAILKAMGDYLKGTEQFSFHAEITFDDVLPTGQKIQYAATNDVAVRRPDRLYAELQGDLGGKRFWYDGKSMTLLDVDQRVYASEAVPAKIDEAMDHVMEKFNFSPPLADFFYQDPYSVLIKNVQFGFYVGLSDIEGIRCHHLAFVEKYIDWQIWVEDGRQMVPRKLLITYKTLTESPQYTAVLSEWDLNAHLSDALFNAELTTKTNVQKIEFLTEETEKEE